MKYQKNKYRITVFLGAIAFYSMLPAFSAIGHAQAPGIPAAQTFTAITQPGIVMNLNQNNQPLSLDLSGIRVSTRKILFQNLNSKCTLDNVQVFSSTLVPELQPEISISIQENTAALPQNALQLNAALNSSCISIAQVETQPQQALNVTHVNQLFSFSVSSPRISQVAFNQASKNANSELAFVNDKTSSEPARSSASKYSANSSADQAAHVILASNNRASDFSQVSRC